MIAYIKLFLYSCFFCIIFCFILGAGASFIVYIKSEYFIIPHGQVKRAIVFGCIAGAAITVATMVFNLIDKYKSRKTPPSDPD